MMADIGYDRKVVEGRTYRTIWKDMKTVSYGKPLSLPSTGEMAVQVFGNFGSATIVFEGSYERVPSDKWFILSDDYGNDVSLSYKGRAMLSGLVGWFRPRILGGDETTDLTVILFDRRIA